MRDPIGPTIRRLTRAGNTPARALRGYAFGHGRRKTGGRKRSLGRLVNIDPLGRYLVTGHRRRRKGRR